MCKLIMIHGITDYSVTLTGQGGFLTLYAPITTAADDILIFFFFFFFQRKCLGISCESSARQMIHMKCQDIFFKKKKKKIECCLLQSLLGILRDNRDGNSTFFFFSNKRTTWSKTINAWLGFVYLVVQSDRVLLIFICNKDPFLIFWVAL